MQLYITGTIRYMSFRFVRGSFSRAAFPLALDSRGLRWHCSSGQNRASANGM